MKKFVLILSVAVCSALMIACSSASGPEAAASKAMTALQKGDYDAYAATYDLSPSDQKMLAGMIEEKLDKQMAEKGGIKSFKIVDSTENDGTAKVNVHVVYKDGSEEDQALNFKEVDGEWKQVMDK